MKLKTLIVDDEHAARKELRHHLEKCDSLSIVGEATNAAEAEHLVAALSYDLIVLDINMPGGSAFTLLKKISVLETKPWVVFVTGDDAFAADAFGVDAVDYVLKPIDPFRLKKALQKVINLAELSLKDKQERPLNGIGLIPVDVKEKTILIPEQDIVYIEANDDYTYLKTITAKYLTKYTVKDLEQRVNKDNFVRCHRSYLLNIKYVKEVLPQPNATLILTVKDEENSQIPVSRAQTKRMKEILGL